MRVIAEGGMGRVYEAIQRGVAGFEKHVALKTLNGAIHNDRQFVSMFIKEAKLVANLVHENIVQIYQLGKYRSGYYFVMEYVDGVSLQDILHFHRLIGKHIPRELAVFIVSRIARGLAYAHNRCNAYGTPMRIVHRDVCPKNILINHEGLPKLADFGIASVVTDQTGEDDSLMGKLAYMAPEQAKGECCDYRADIYALGLVLFALLANTEARDGQLNQDDLLESVQNGEIHWDRLPEDLDPGISRILINMLARDPSGRFRCTSDLAHTLEHYIYHKGHGPTIVTLSDYLCTEMPRYYGEQALKTLPGETVKTMIIHN